MKEAETVTVTAWDVDILFEPHVDDNGIYMRSDHDPRFGRIVMTKELFVEAYNKWIKDNPSFGEDTADDWSE